MPILGVVASSILKTPAGDFVQLHQYVAASDVSSVTFSNIDQTYKHLEIWTNFRSTRTALNASAYVQFNGGPAYSGWFSQYETNGSPTIYIATGTASNYQVYMYETAGASAAAGIFGAGRTIISDYTNASKKKTVITRGGNNQNLAAGTNAGANHDFYHYGFTTASAITSMTFTTDGGFNIAAGSVITVYGVK